MSLIKAVINFFKRAINIVLLNIHTILLFVGIAFVVIAAFLFNEILGYLVLGLALITISKLIDEST